MFKHLLRAAALLAALTLTGCRRRPALPPGVAPEDKTTRGGEMSDIVVGHCLQLPRAQQVKILDEWTETVRNQTSAIRKNPGSVELLPRVLPPLTVPVFHEAKFSP